MVEKDVYRDYACIVTCNERLLVRLEGELDITSSGAPALTRPVRP